MEPLRATIHTGERCCPIEHQFIRRKPEPRFVLKWGFLFAEGRTQQTGGLGGAGPLGIGQLIMVDT